MIKLNFKSAGKWSIITGASLLSLAGSAQWAATSQFSPASLVQKLEAIHNCRAEITDTKVRLFGFPSVVEVTGLKLVPRDLVAEQLTPLPARGVVTAGETMISVERAALEINIWNLVTGKADVRSVILDRPDIRGVRDKKGVSSIRTMLGKVKKVGAEEVVKAPEPDAPAVAEEPFHISELPFSAVLGEARIRDGSYALRNDKKRTWTDIRDINFLIKDLQVNPGNLAATAPASVSAGARMVVDNHKLNVRTLDFTLSMDGAFQLFDAATGTLNNNLDFAFTVKKGSMINRIPTLEKLTVKLDGLKERLGLDLGLQPEGVLTKDLVIKSRLQNGMVNFDEDITFPFDTYRIKLEKGSWISTSDEQHMFQGKLMASEAISKKALTGARSYLTKKSPALAAIFEEHILSKMVTDAGNLTLPFVSTEEIGHPEVNFAPKFEEGLKQAMVLAGKDLLLDTVKGGDSLNNALELLNGLKKKGDDEVKDKPEAK